MFIIPYIHNVVEQNTFKVNIIKLLTLGGQGLWEEDSELKVDRDILNPNDIYTKNTHYKLGNDIMLCEVDTTKTNINDFYKWEEIDLESTDIFCWRTYIYFADNNEIPWLQTPNNQLLSNYKVEDILKRIVQNSI
jgi:hypothetical protein